MGPIQGGYRVLPRELSKVGEGEKRKRQQKENNIRRVGQEKEV